MTEKRVIVDARCTPGTSGGVETFVAGLAAGLAALDFHDLTVEFLTTADHDGWIHPYTTSHVIAHPMSPSGAFKRAARKGRIWAIRPYAHSFGVIPPRGRDIERLAPDVVHLPFQSGHPVNRPFIYHPHDLQHRHLPEFFSPRLRAHREVSYRALCREASAISVCSSWIKDDLVRQFHIHPDKIFVIPLAPVEPTPLECPDLSKASLLPTRYVTYPAVPWAHKNHQELVKAITLLRQGGLDVPLVLTGGGSNRSSLADMAAHAGISDLVTDLGYVTQHEVNQVIRGAQAIVVPTLFEAASFPIWEAFRLGTPVTCSNVTSLPRQVGPAALIFNPRSPDEIAHCIERLWTDEPLRHRLVELGRIQLTPFTWRETARRFVALYRRLAGLPLGDEDRHLLAAPPAI